MPSIRDRRRRLLRGLPAVVGVVFAYAGLTGLTGLTGVTGVAWAAGGTPVCGAVPAGQSVWTAAGSPYVICASGAEIGPGAAVVINGQLGPVDVLGAGAGGLLVDGGTLQTTLTSDAASATFAADASNPDSKWGGVTVKTGDNNTKPTLGIDHASFSDAEIGLQASGLGVLSLSSVSFSRDQLGLVSGGNDVTLTDVGGTSGVRADLDGAPTGAFTADGVTVSSSLFGLSVSNAAATTLTDVHLDRISPYGALGVTGPSTIGDPQAPPGTVQMHDVTVDHSAGIAAWLTNEHVTADVLDSVTGYANGIDAVTFSGQLDSDLTWRSITANTAPAPLGYAVNGRTVVARAHTVSLPADAEMWLDGPMLLHGSRLAGCAGSATLRAGLPDRQAMGPVTVDVAADSSTGAPGNLCLDHATLHGIGVTAAREDGSSDTSVPVTITHSSVDGAGLTSTGAPVVVTDSTWSGGDISVAHAPVTFQRNALTESKVAVTDESTQPVLITGNTITHPYGAGISVLTAYSYPVTYATDVTVTGNTVTGADFSRDLRLYPHPVENAAIVLHWVKLDDAARIAGNKVAGNLVDALAISGEIDDDMRWVSPYDDSALHAAGFVSDGLTVRGAHTVTIPKNAMVKIGGRDDTRYAQDLAPGLRLIGARLDASAGGATFAPSTDDSVGIPMCFGYDTCVPRISPNTAINHRWAGITVDPDLDSGARGSVVISNARLRDGSLVDDSGATTLPDGSPYGIRLSHLSVLGASIELTGVRADINHLTVDQATPMVFGDNPAYSGGLLIRDGNGSVVKNARFANMQYVGPAIQLTDSTALLRRIVATWSTSAVFESAWSPGPNGGPAVSAAGAPVRVECLTVGNNVAGLKLSRGSVVRDSNLVFTPYGDPGVSVTARHQYVDARGNWWGRVAGATAAQTAPSGAVRTDHPRPSPSTCAPPAPGLTPAVPSKPAVTARGTTHRVTVTWLAPRSDGGTAVTSYVVTVGARSRVVGAGIRTAVFRHLVNGHRYRVTVAACNVDGTGRRAVTWARPHVR